MRRVSPVRLHPLDRPALVEAPLEAVLGQVELRPVHLHLLLLLLHTRSLRHTCMSGF